MAVYRITKQTQCECIESDFEWPETAQTTKQIERSCSGKQTNNGNCRCFSTFRLIQFLHTHMHSVEHIHTWNRAE